MIIDAHQHLWRIGQNGHEWPTPDLGEIYHDFGPEDLAAACDGLNIDGTILVQSQPSDADTDWMLAVAAATPLIRGVVGWTDFAAAEASQRIAHLARQPKLKGLRPMLQGLPQDDWIVREDIRPALEAMTIHDLAFDALVYTRHLPFIDQLARHNPDLRIVIDHGAKPPLGHPEDMAQWQGAISAVARNANVSCKLSGLLTEMPDEQNEDLLTPCANHLLAVFGPDRLMWGSDWPVILLKDSYSHWFNWTLRWLTDKPETTQTAIMGETARRFYQL
ncbi:amidohydrolase family protein [Asticcacaulis sp.]|uniref:amidohydrolase family protein n=1 Tax=Asticcacaulis sp. TaxID=1872648 RepID=UPI002CA7A1AA|nr:amidohydrolase family protein [Asticcacaulis sp.]HTM80944.1 amidohydrolase family protein [Asticcacaulis sp.]